MSSSNVTNITHSSCNLDILVHTENILVVQTNAGEQLDDAFLLKDKNIINGAISQCTGYSDSEPAMSATDFGSFNLGLHVNDAPEKVLANRALLLAQINDYIRSTNTNNGAKNINKGVHSVYWLNQIHSNKVVRVTCDRDLNDVNQINDLNQVNKISPKMSLTPPSADALITDLPNTGLAIMTADCVPIVLYHQKSGQIAAIHAGWQGLANGVITNTYAKFEENLDIDTRESSNRHNPIQAWIGACISQSCYEVSLEVVEKLLSACEGLGMNIDEIKQAIVGEHTNPEKAWLDLPKLAELQLNKLGIEVNAFENNTMFLSKPATETQHSPSPSDMTLTVQSEVKPNSNVSGSSLAYACSYSNSSYYSYRRMTHLGLKNTGRMALLIIRLR